MDRARPAGHDPRGAAAPVLNILGLSCFYHDAGACLLQDGVVVAAAEEERFSRLKHDAGLPAHAADYCLSAAGLEPDDLDFIIFYEKPLL